MSLYRSDTLEKLIDFTKGSDQLAIAERNPPKEAPAFFKKVLSSPFETDGKVRKESALKDIRGLLNEIFSDEIQQDPFYDLWLKDMAKVGEVFCDIENSDAIGFWLGSKRGCRRYHVDMVPRRLLVTYTGKGTEWLPDKAADREAFSKGEPNNKIIKKPAAIQYINPWDVAIFRGGSKGVLHRTPDEALHSPSILMRLDHISFWEKVVQPAKRQQQ